MSTYQSDNELKKLLHSPVKSSMAPPLSVSTTLHVASMLTFCLSILLILNVSILDKKLSNKSQLNC